MMGIVLIAILVVGYFIIVNSKVKNKGAVLLEKTITAVISAIIYSFYFAYLGYTPVEERQAGVGYTSLEGLLLISFMISLPVFLICGGLYSFFADSYLEKIHTRNALMSYISGFFVYIAGGLLIAGVFFAAILLIEGKMNELHILGMFKASALPALLFYHISLLIKKSIKFVAG